MGVLDPLQHVTGIGRARHLGRLRIFNPAEIDRVLTDGAAGARAVARPVVDEAKALVGFWR